MWCNARGTPRNFYTSMVSIEGLRPCDFTIPNFPDYDDSCGACDGGFGTWCAREIEGGREGSEGREERRGVVSGDAA